MSNRKEVRERHEVNLSNYSSLENLRNQIDELIAQYGKDAIISWGVHYDDFVKFSVETSRPENDVELKKRLELEALTRQKQEEREQQEYLRLSEKFGSKRK